MFKLDKKINYKTLIFNQFVFQLNFIFLIFSYMSVRFMTHNNIT